MTCWFFMSYARADDQEGDAQLVRDFYDELKSAVSKRVQNPTPESAYFDQESLEPGDPWPNDIAEALRGCRTFVPIMTARYFTREYCGKEWGIFEDRCRALGGASLPPLIIPVLWVRPEEGELPQFATALQVTFDPERVQQEERKFLADYETYGMEYVAKRRKTTHGNTYDTIVITMASRIIHAARDHPLQSLAGAGLPSLTEAPNRFVSVPRAAGEAATASNRANFAFVAGDAQEMLALRPDSQQYYGGGGALDWRPYAPGETQPIALIAQKVANDKDLIVNWVAAKAGLVAALQQAERENSVVIVVVDPWTAMLPTYRQILSHFDQFQFRNCVVLIPWNRLDPRTQNEQDRLFQCLRQTLARNYEGRKEVYFRSEINAHAELRAAISSALSDLEALLAPNRAPARKVGSGTQNEPPQMDATRSGS